MRFLLSVSRLIDALNERIGRTVYWLVLVMVLVSAGNATSRVLPLTLRGIIENLLGGPLNELAG